jgi:hypothetical protein
LPSAKVPEAPFVVGAVNVTVWPATGDPFTVTVAVNAVAYGIPTYAYCPYPLSAETVTT